MLATAVTELFPDVKVAGGPPIDNGFYYDFAREQPFTPEDLERIEARMREIVAADQPFEYAETTRDEAHPALRGRGGEVQAPLPLADPAPAPRSPSTRNGRFLDLCRGPHVREHRRASRRSSSPTSPAPTGWAASATRCSSASTAPRSRHREELEEHLKRIEEALKRDHRKLGKELDLFSIHEEVGAGLIHWHPRGGMVRHLIEEFWKDEHLKRGYQLVYTPHIASEKLYEISGHLENYADLMYAPMDIDGQPYRVKPMNCPIHIMIYKTRKHSLPRAADALRRARHRLPLRALGRAARHGARARLHAGRLAHLLHPGAAGGRGRRASST